MGDDQFEFIDKEEDDNFFRAEVSSCQEYFSIKRNIYKHRLYFLVCFVVIASFAIFFIGKTVVDSEMQKTKYYNIVYKITNYYNNDFANKTFKIQQPESK